MNELKNKIYDWLKDNEENFRSDLESLIESIQEVINR